MASTFGRRVWVWILLGSLCAPSSAEEAGLARRHHSWGQFHAGAWKLVRVTTEAYDGGDTLSSVTETRTTLSRIDDEGVTLVVDVAVMVGGKRLDTEPQTVHQGFHGEVAANPPVSEDLGQAEIVVENCHIPCRVVRLEFPRAGSKKVSTIYYSDAVDPYILRRETAVYGDDSKQPVSRTTVEVVALEAPCRMLRGLRAAARVKSVQQDASGTTTTWASTSSLVPGGVISYTSQQVDNDGRLVRSSSLQLLDYGLDESQGRSGLFWRWRNARSRTAH